MDDHTLDQRIKYLIEHGGLWHDPIDALRREMRWTVATAAAVLGLLELLF